MFISALRHLPRPDHFVVPDEEAFISRNPNGPPSPWQKIAGVITKVAYNTYLIAGTVTAIGVYAGACVGALACLFWLGHTAVLLAEAAMKAKVTFPLLKVFLMAGNTYMVAALSFSINVLVCAGLAIVGSGLAIWALRRLLNPSSYETELENQVRNLLNPLQENALQEQTFLQAFHLIKLLSNRRLNRVSWYNGVPMLPPQKVEEFRLACNTIHALTAQLAQNRVRVGDFVLALDLIPQGYEAHSWQIAVLCLIQTHCETQRTLLSQYFPKGPLSIIHAYVIDISDIDDRTTGPYRRDKLEIVQHVATSLLAYQADAQFWNYRKDYAPFKHAPAAVIREGSQIQWNQTQDEDQFKQWLNLLRSEDNRFALMRRKFQQRFGAAPAQEDIDFVRPLLCFLFVEHSATICVLRSYELAMMDPQKREEKSRQEKTNP